MEDLNFWIKAFGFACLVAADIVTIIDKGKWV